MRDVAAHDCHSLNPPVIPKTDKDTRLLEQRNSHRIQGCDIPTPLRESRYRIIIYVVLSGVIRRGKRRKISDRTHHQF